MRDTEIQPSSRPRAGACRRPAALVLVLGAALSSAAAAAPASWWDAAYASRRQLTVTTGANSPDRGYAGYTVRLPAFDTQTLIAGGELQSDCDDLRVVRWDGAAWSEVDRHLIGCNTSATDIRFALQADIAASTGDTSYFLYWGNPAAGAPAPLGTTNVYLWYDDASVDRSGSYVHGRIDAWHGTGWDDSLSWNPGGYYTYSNGDNRTSGYRRPVAERDVYIEAEFFHTGCFPNNMTTGVMIRGIIGSGSGGGESSSHYYASNRGEQAGCGGGYAEDGDIFKTDRATAAVDGPDPGAIATGQWRRQALAGWLVNPTNLKFWDSDSGWPAPGWPDAGDLLTSGTDASDYEGRGFAAVMTAQDQARLRNVLVRRYVEPEPVVTAGAGGGGPACGPIPGTYPLSSGAQLDVDRNVTVNGNGVTRGTTGADSVVDVNGTRSTVAQALPELDPDTFPANGSTNDASDADSPFNSTTEVFYRTIYVTWGATASFSGGGPFHIENLVLYRGATVNLDAGTYYVNNVYILDRDVTFNVTGEPVILHVGNTVFFANNARGATFNAGGSVTGLRVYLHSGATFDPWMKSRDLDFTGVIFGPQSGTVNLGRSARFHGAVVTSGPVVVGRDAAFTYSPADQAAVSALSTCAAPRLDHFVISHDGFGINCLAETVSVTPMDGSGNPLSGYAGTMVLDTQSGRGSWIGTGGGGTLTDATADDGLAEYRFSGSESFPVTFLLEYRAGPTPVDIDVYDSTDPGRRDDDTEGSMAFSPSGFTVTANPLSNPPPGVISDPVPAQTAALPFALHITAFGQTPTDPECGVIESYDGAKTLSFWSTRDNPASGSVAVTVDGAAIAASEAGAAAQAVGFVQGQATVSARYKDVGRIRIEMKDDSVADPALAGGIRGGTNLFVVKPDHFDLSAISRTADGAPNPGAADENGPVFVRAGEAFSVTVTARDADGDATPNYGRESPAEGVALTPALVAAGGTDNPPLQQVSGFGAFSGGRATGTDFSWGEVGIITLTPSVADGDYLGAGDVSGTASGNLGRFIPWDFGVVLNAPAFATACGTFSYVGQPFGYATPPVISVTARSASGATTQNYTGAWWKITDAKLAADGNRSYSAASGTLDTGVLPAPDPVIADGGDGTGTLTFGAGGGLAFTRGLTPVAPFDAEVSLSLDVVDEDDVAYAGNPARFGAPAPGAGIAFDNGKTMRWGRLALRNAHGSELMALPLPAGTQYWDGSGFVANTEDGCSALSIGDAVLSNDLESGQTDGDIRIGGGLTTLSIANTPVAAGDPGLAFSAPAAGNTGYADLRIDLSTATGADLPWLRFDWDGDGSDDDPAARATFGIYQGSPNLIHLREPWN